MTYRNPIIVMAIAVGVAACGDSSDSTQASTSRATAEGVCLQQHADANALDALLTKQDITPYVQDAAENVETDYDKEYVHAISYSWPSNRTRTMNVAGRTLTMPKQNGIGLDGIKTYTGDDYYPQDNNDPIKRFERYNHNMTAEEKKKAREAINEALEEQDKTTREAGKAIVGAATSSKIMFEPVTGIGNAAAWNFQVNRLNVLTGETEFSLYIDVSDDVEKNQAVAKELAQSILADCADEA